MKFKVVYLTLLVLFLQQAVAFAQIPDTGILNQTQAELNIKPQTDYDYGQDPQYKKEMLDKEEISPIDKDSSLDSNVNALDDNKEKVALRVSAFEIDNSELLTDEEINNITKEYLDKDINIDDLKGLVNELNVLYKRKGYLTAKAYLPSQKIKDGIVKIGLVEGRVGQIIIDGNKWTRKSYIVGKISQKPDKILDLGQLEKDIIKFNRDNVIKLRANIKPGEQFGTTDINLIATDPNPFHITPTFDNTGRRNVGVLRGGISFRDDSLFGYRDQFVMGYSRARSTDLAYSSYSIPLGNHGTRVAGNFSFSNIKVSSGPFKDLNIEGNSYNYGGLLSQSFISTRKFDFSGDIGVNFRQVTTFFDEVPLFTTQIRSLALGLNAQYRDRRGFWSTRHGVVLGLDLLGGNARFFKYNGYLTRVHNFGHGVLGIFRSAVQLTDDQLPPIEQFQVGGSGTVRGYSEGLLIGDNGYLFSGELRFPLPLPKKVGKLMLRDRIRGVAFVDHGAAFVDDGNTTSPHHTNFLTSIGLGLRGSVTKYLSGRIDWGFALGRREDPQPTARMHFGLEANPF